MPHRRPSARSFRVLVVLLPLSTVGCFLPYEGAFIESDDVRLELPGEVTMRALPQDPQGDVQTLIRATARDVNGWVGDTVDVLAAVVGYLNGHRETSRDGQWRIYGPFNDDQDRDLSWMARIRGDDRETAFELLVGAHGAGADDRELVLEGSIAVAPERRSGGFSIHFDPIEAHPELKDPADGGKIFAGTIAVVFERSTVTEDKHVGIDFQGFSVESFSGDDAWGSDDAYDYDRDDEGAGEFHLAVEGRFDDNAWGGHKQNRMVLDALWSADEAGRTRGQILAVENAESGLPDGDLVIHECFAGDGVLTFRSINEPYASETPEYALGDEGTCVFPADAFGG